MLDSSSQSRLSDRAFAALALAIFAIVTACGAYFHEPWRDEAEIWLIARDLDFSAMLQHFARNGGTPTIWPILNFGLVKLGFPYQAEFVLHWIIGLSAAGVFLFSSPFSRLTKTLFVFSYLMAYEYIVVARHYGLGVLFFFLALAFYGSRHEKPLRFSFLLLLLFNTNAHSLMAAIFLSALFLWEKLRRPWRAVDFASVIVIMIGGLLFLAQVLPASGAAVREYTSVAETWKTVVNWSLRALADNLLFETPVSRRTELSFFAVAALIYGALLFELARRRIALLFVLATHAWLFYMFTKVYYGGVRHHGMLLVFLVGGFWIAHHYSGGAAMSIRRQNLRAAVALNLFLLFGVVKTGRVYADEIRYSYSGAEEAAHFLRERPEGQYLTVAYTPWAACAILPYLGDKKFWYADSENFGSFLLVDKAYFDRNYELVNGRKEIKITNEQVVNRALARFPDEQNLLLILSRPLPASYDSQFRLIFQNRKRIFGATDETYFIYARQPKLAS